jgi:C4-dicarboxylate-specific signal transduction histidine kinase
MTATDSLSMTTRVATQPENVAQLLSSEVLSDIVHKLGHEIGNPLTAIISLASIFERFESEQEPARLRMMADKLAGYGASITAEAWRVNQLSERLVMLLTKRSANINRVNLVEVADRALRRVRSRYGYQQEDVLSNLAMSEPVMVASDSEQLLLLVSELLLNALQSASYRRSSITEVPPGAAPGAELGQATPPGPTLAPVSLFVRQGKDSANLMIRNELSEPLPLELSELFNPMVTTLADHKHIGLGLTVCAAILGRCGGNLRLLEEVNADGISFMVDLSLPLAA